MILAGEISSSAEIDTEKVVRSVINEIGYDRSELGFDGHTAEIINLLDRQSPDIAQGVDSALEVREENGSEIGAGDQGIIFGYLHLDFVPVSDEARKNGMRVRNSLTGALRQQGFTGKGISKTITMDWLEQEKAHIGQLMLEHGIEWVKLGTHEKHRTVSQFKADKLREEIEAAESVLEQKQQEITSAAGQLEAVGSELAQQRQQLSDGMQELSSVKEQISSAQDDLDQKVKQVNDILKYLPNITRDDKMEQQYDNIRYELMDMLKSGLSIIRNKDDIVDKIDKLYGIVKKAIDAAYKYSYTIYDLRQLCEKYGKELAETKDKIKDLSKRNRELNKENEAMSAENDYLNELYEQIRQIMPSVLTMAKDRVRAMHEQQQQQACEQQKRKRSWGLE